MRFLLRVCEVLNDMCLCMCLGPKGHPCQPGDKAEGESYISSSSFETWSSTGTFSAALSQFLIAVAQQPLHL